MMRTALSERPRPQLVEVSQPAIEWTPADRIEPGEYSAYSRSAKIYRDPQFKRWVCAVQFDVLDASLNELIGRVTWFLNLGDRAKPHAGRRSLYWAAWLAASGKPPARRDRLSPVVFIKRHARILVGDTAQDLHQQPVTEFSCYSVVRKVLVWETGETR